MSGQHTPKDEKPQEGAPQCCQAAQAEQNRQMRALRVETWWLKVCADQWSTNPSAKVSRAR